MKNNILNLGSHRLRSPQVSQLVKFGKQPVQFMLAAKYYADKPDGGPEWGLRFAVTLLFPK